MIGVVGLSVGQATALTLALEGIGGEYRLADFDTLALSNMNRIRSGVHNVGVPKAVLTTRGRSYEDRSVLLKVTLFPRGLTEESIGAFFDDGGALDLVFEECDDLAMKVRVREEARKRRVPVLMESSDRGMLDIERFDEEPDRPVFHGLAGDLDAASLSGLSTYEKVPIVMAILGGTSISKRMAASLVDVDATLKTWPQLASGVALGGALNARCRAPRRARHAARLGALLRRSRRARRARRRDREHASCAARAGRSGGRRRRGFAAAERPPANRHGLTAHRRANGRDARRVRHDGAERRQLPAVALRPPARRARFRA